MNRARGLSRREAASTSQRPNTFTTLAARMDEVANSPILANALVDSAGRETYLAAFLNGPRQVTACRCR